MKAMGRPPPQAFTALDAFAARHPDETWETFRDLDNGQQYRALRQALCDAQHGLCAYCEVAVDRPRLDGLRAQIEHVIEKSRSSELGRNLHLDGRNLVLSCTGGGRMELQPPLYHPPLPENLSCGQSKELRGKSVQLVDCRDLPLAPPVLLVDDTGRIVTDPEGCHMARVDERALDQTVDVLGLRCPRLQSGREDWWIELLVLSEDLLEAEDADGLAALARGVLLPDAEGRLSPFWSTSRSFFGTRARLSSPPSTASPSSRTQ
ncbi:MAG: hypothetical protein R3F43_06605 [bacterium]